MDKDEGIWHINEEPNSDPLCGGEWQGLISTENLKQPKAIAHLNLCPECLERIEITVKPVGD